MVSAIFLIGALLGQPAEIRHGMFCGPPRDMATGGTVRYCVPLDADSDRYGRINPAWDGTPVARER